MKHYCFLFSLKCGRMKSVINHFKGNAGFPRLRIGTFISFLGLKYSFILQSFIISICHFIV